MSTSPAPTSTDTTVSFVLPWPPKALSPNARVHFHEKASAAATYRHACRVAGLNVRRDLERRGMTFPLRAPVTVIITFVLANRQRRDWDNLLSSVKAGIDGGLVDSGLISDDSIAVIERLGLAWEQGEKAAIMVRLTAPYLSPAFAPAPEPTAGASPWLEGR